MPLLTQLGGFHLRTLSRAEGDRTEAGTDDGGGYSRSGFYFLPYIPCARLCVRAYERPRPISSGRPPRTRVRRFIVSRPIRDNCCWPVPDARAYRERDAKPFFPCACVPAPQVRTSTAAYVYPARLFYYVRNFSPASPPRARVHTSRAHTHSNARVHARYDRGSRLLERASFIMDAVNAPADRRGDPVNWNVARSIKLLK